MNRFASIIFFATTLFVAGTEPSLNAPPFLTPEFIRSTALQQLFRLSPRLFSSSSPDSAASFTELQRLGIETIISVDGAAPDVEGARDAGICYIHLPMGYNGSSASNALSIVKAAQLSGGPVLVHCHHGKHRGPAAAALIAVALHEWNSQQALSWMKTAGNSPDYPGLFAQVASFRPPTETELSNVSTNFSEKATPSGLVEAMVSIDQHWEHLRAVQLAGYMPPANHPDLLPQTESLLLVELYRELQRSPEMQNRDQRFAQQLRDAEQEARDLHDFFKSHPATISPAKQRRAADLFTRVQQRCASCHESYRN